MMRLLVSVRNGEEALAAVAGGAEIIDAKEPSSGALGAVSLPAFGRIVDAVGGRRPVTAAIGDADDPDAVETRARAFGAAGAAFVKVGLSGVDSSASASRLLAAGARGAAAGGAVLVAVAYADFDRVGSLEPDAIVQAAVVSGARGVLLDTATKQGHDLLQLLPIASLTSWITLVHARGMFAAVAGQLDASGLDRVRACGADIAGVRGAACEGGRDGRVSVRNVRALAAALQAPAHRTLPRADRAAAPGGSTRPR